MSLLQITEPGQTGGVHLSRLAAGIDLGTTNSLIATVQNGHAECLADETGQTVLPSVVGFLADGRVELGHVALQRHDADPSNTILSVKRFMGRGQHEVAHAATMPYRFAATPGMVSFETVQGVKSPVEISAKILGALAQRAQTQLGGPLHGVVITVPAYFDEAQRQATKDAARLAGLNVLRLLNEPTAAAVAYGLDNASEGVYAVYDLGGGTFDLSVLRLSRGIFEVIATSGDSALGGDDFDHRLYDWVLEQTELAPLTAEEARKLLLEVRHAKEALSTATEALIHLPQQNGKCATLSLSRDELVRLTADLVRRSLAPIRKVLRDAELTVEEIKGVVMVGGATRMLHVRQAVADFFAQPPLTNLDPDAVVAIGAAIQANVLAGNRQDDDDWLLLDVIPLSLGLETMGGLVEKIIQRNTTLPIERAQEFTTFKDGQTAMAFHVVQGERELVTDCRSLARFELRGIPPLPAGVARIRVSFQVDADGLLSVSAREASTGVQTQVLVKPSYGLGDDEIAQMLKAGMAYADDDMRTRALREQQVEGARLIEFCQQALERDASLLGETEKNQIIAAIDELQPLLASGEHERIRAAIKKLAAATEEFASRRMDKSIREALSGKKVSEISA